MLLCSLPRTERVCPHVYQDLPIWCTTVQLSHGFKDPGIKTGDDLFPLSALLNYLSRRGNKAGTLLAPCCHPGGWHPVVKNKIPGCNIALSAAHLPAKDYAGHIFRIGITTAAMTDLEDSTIQTLGHWKSSSYQLNIRANLRQLASMSASLSKCDIELIALFSITHNCGHDLQG